MRASGKIKRTALSDYKNVRKNGLIAIGLDEGDEIAAVRLTNGSNRLFVATRNGMAIRIDESDVRPMSRSAHGVKAIPHNLCAVLPLLSTYPSVFSASFP